MNRPWGDSATKEAQDSRLSTPMQRLMAAVDEVIAERNGFWVAMHKDWQLLTAQRDALLAACKRAAEFIHSVPRIPNHEGEGALVAIKCDSAIALCEKQ